MHSLSASLSLLRRAFFVDFLAQAASKYSRIARQYASVIFALHFRSYDDESYSASSAPSLRFRHQPEMKIDGYWTLICQFRRYARNFRVPPVMIPEFRSILLMRKTLGFHDLFSFLLSWRHIRAAAIICAAMPHSYSRTPTSLHMARLLHYRFDRYSSSPPLYFSLPAPPLRVASYRYYYISILSFFSKSSRGARKYVRWRRF